jgi:uncharacterized Fe-S center protein
MIAARVYFTNLRTSNNINLLDNMERLIRKAGFEDVISQKDKVGIKVHFGEMGNLAYIRPPYIRRVVAMVKKAGALPFVTDANTLYKGQRANAIDHLETAIANGFDYSVISAPLIIADGLTGRDFVKVPLEGCKHFKNVHIGSAAVYADALLVVSHFKCHELTGFGGAIKNLGMGLGARSGKQQMHTDVLPKINEKFCASCEQCSKWCPADAIGFVPWNGNKKGQKAAIDYEKCWGCGECLAVCKFDAIIPTWKTTPAVMQEKMAEYALGAAKDKENKTLYVSFVNDVSPACDCHGYNDFPIVQDIGILASKDPVALDKACADMVNQMPPLSGSIINDLPMGHDKFKAVHPNIDWVPQLTHAQEIGLGNMEYNLEQI